MVGTPKHDVEQLRAATRRTIKNQKLIDVIASFLDYQEIQAAAETLFPGEWAGRQIETATETQRNIDHRAQLNQWREQGDPDEPEPTMIRPQQWLAQDAVIGLAFIDLELRTSDKARRPIESILKPAQEGKGNWADDVVTAAEAIFKNALAADGELSRVELLPWRYLAKSEPRWESVVARDVADQYRSYLRLWQDLLDAFNRKTVRGVTIRTLLEDLGAIEDGFLTRAVGMSSRRQQTYAHRFARVAFILLDASTEPKT